MDFVNHSQTYLPRLLDGMKWTLALTGTAGFFGTLVGLITALARISRSRLLYSFASGYITLFRGTPLLLQILFVYAALPQVGLRFSAFTSVSLALSLNAGAYIAEIIRAAIQSIDKGQMEAARSLGMSYGMAMRRVILPQTFRRLLPPMVNEMAALSKDSSLAMVVGFLELMKVSQSIASRTFMLFSTYFWTALGYLIIVVTLTTMADRLEKWLEARG